MISWLNRNQGFVMAVLTVVYVGTTAFMAWLMRRTNRLAACGFDGLAAEV